MSQFKINKLCIVGVGSMGGSLARALRKNDAVTTIVGYGRNLKRLEVAKALGVVNEITTELSEAINNADVIVVATPLGAMQDIFMALKDIISSESIITDVGSAKQFVIDAAKNVFGEIPTNFVPAHPIAGTEKSGVESAQADLFEQRRVILTTQTNTEASAVKTIRTMWQTCGANVVDMQVEHHDEVLAATSHLPHMLAYSLVDTLARMDDQQEIFEYAAGGFRDFTRIASSDPQMWHDICVANREQLVKMLHAFNDDLQQLTRAVEKADSGYLKDTFTRAKQARDKFCG